MSTQIYPGLPQSQIKSAEETQLHLTQQWLLETILLPEVQKIHEELGDCLTRITETKPIGMALTSKQTEGLRGFMERKSADIVNFDVTLDCKAIGRKIRIKSNGSFELEQINSLIGILTDAVSDAFVLKQDLEEYGTNMDLSKVLFNFTKFKSLIEQALRLLQDPPRNLLFPLNQDQVDLNKLCFTDLKRARLDDLLSMELFIQNSDICMNFVYFEKIKDQPWCEFDPETGMSYIDKIRNEVRDNKMTIAQIQEGDRRSLGHLLGIQKFTHMDYFQKGLTYKKNAVIKLEEVGSIGQDANILTVDAKLRALLGIVEKICHNLYVIEDTCSSK